MKKLLTAFFLALAFLSEAQVKISTMPTAPPAQSDDAMIPVVIGAANFRMYGKDFGRAKVDSIKLVDSSLYFYTANGGWQRAPGNFAKPDLSAYVTQANAAAQIRDSLNANAFSIKNATGAGDSLMRVTSPNSVEFSRLAFTGPGATVTKTAGTITVNIPGGGGGDSTTTDLRFVTSAKGPVIIDTVTGKTYRLRVVAGALAIQELTAGATTPPPSTPSAPSGGTDLTFATNGLNAWTDVSASRNNIYQTTGSTTALSDQSVPANTDGGAMMQFTGTEENPYLVLTTNAYFQGQQYDAPGWFAAIKRSGSSYYVWGGYGNFPASTDAPSGSNILQAGDWVRVWREGATGRVFIQTWRSTTSGGTGNWVTVYDINAAAGGTTYDITAQLYVNLSTYTAVTTKATNPKKI